MQLYKKLTLSTAFLCLSLTPTSSLIAQTKTNKTDQVYVDKKGVLRWNKNNKEAAFFGVNYTLPFAYGYRSVKALGIDPKQAIDQDVYHMARLGLDAFRVHVWDTEISDTTGNLLDNEHLRLFDYLIFKLKERNIKVLITPIAFWGNGYPERDEQTPGFSAKYGKKRALVEEPAFKAQENYLKQLLQHKNPYTNLTYLADPDIIAAEINNEPQHSGPKERTTEYVNRMTQAIRSIGWTKPVFYNISESPTYADAIAKTNVDGFSFQWYPTGLVSNHTLQGNYLSHVDKYNIPFDTIPQFANKALMVYEFDAGDVLQPVMYPAMARSFRSAGFQWATQFAYDPLATAYGNTEYQTHYLNLAYTPAKAISLLIASKAFHQLPRLKEYGTYPNSSSFGAFRIDYRNALSEMNTKEEFYYTTSTTSKPQNAKSLQHVAGVGSSPVVNYKGSGAYFLDKLENGVWRLEVMPDAVVVSDPFAKASPKKEVTRLQYNAQAMEINLQDLGKNFSVKGLNEGNIYTVSAQNGAFEIQPGTYFITKAGVKNARTTGAIGTLKLNEFVAPKPVSNEVFVKHEPFKEVSAGKSYEVSAQVAGVNANDKVILQANNTAATWKTVPMERRSATEYAAQIPVEMVVPGEISYKIIVQKNSGEQVAFPGNYKGDPGAWDYYHNDSWKTLVASEQGGLSLFNAATDRNVFVFPNLWRGDERQLATTTQPGQMVLKLTAKEPTKEQVMGFQQFVGDKLAGRESELDSFQKLVVRVKVSGTSQAVPLKVALITKDAAGYSAKATVSGQFQDIEIPLNALQADSYILLPRAYPGFQNFSFKSAKTGTFTLSDAEKLQLTISGDAAGLPAGCSLEVEQVWLAK